ncbi:polysaccharide biosynthesis tyrosine autokinase [Granulicella sp. WH15]|uniref:GumC family protein n=1 Tax=Granulicella sp. WH15 TaxID=2602070 RepID=UPI0013671CD8|nr:polysaccharide biosynthesis tyrosine autokinase [Granulicella sp. WH15]QHN03111.1 polysaccharide biosynthesis tyrosine autokinase [Granulicella sp. WH15]
MTPDASQDATAVGAPRPTFSFSAPESTDTTLSEALVVLRKRRWVLIVAIILGVLGGLYRGFTEPRLYVATGRIQVHSSSSASEYKMNVATAAMGGDEDSQTKLQSEVSILQSDSLMASLARELNLVNNPDFLETRDPIQHKSMDDLAVREGVIKTLKGNLTVALVPKTDIIKISYSSLNAKLSADIVNKLIADYIQRSYESRFASTQRVSQWLSGQLDDLKQKVETSQQRMLDLQRKLGVLGVDSSHDEIAAAIEDLQKAAGVARLQRIVSEARYRLLAGMDPDAMEGSIDIPMNPGINNLPPPALTSLRQSLATAKSNYAMLEGTLGVNHPQALASRAQIDELSKEVTAEQNRLLEQAKQNFELAKSNQTQTESVLEAQKTAAYKMRDDLVEYTLRQREFESDRTLYEGLLQRLRSAGVEAGLESMEVDIVDQAIPPARPTMRSKSFDLLLASLVALIIGVLLAFLLENLDTGLRSIAEIEAITELPSLAIIPRSRRSTAEQLAGMTTVERNINVLTQPKSQFTESFRSLRTALLLSMSEGREPKYILFTSATPSEGKTTAATNLATVMAQGDARVLLIDADLRRPNVHHRFGLAGKLGLSTILSGSSTLENSVQNVPEVPNLDVLASGPVPPFPTEMLSSESMSQLLAKAGQMYGYVIIDSPPILSVTDGVLLARQSDITVLVIRHGKSSKPVVRRARDLLVRSGAPLSGIVLNAVDLNSPEYYGYYGYSGYSYTSVDSSGWESKGAPTEHRNGKKGNR